MKIAVLLPGELRNALETFPSLYEHIIEPTSADIYVSSYHTDNENEILHEIKPKKVFLEDKVDLGFDEEKYLKNQPTRLTYISKPMNCMYMWRKIKQCFDLVEGEYDYIIKTRPDCHYTENINMNVMIPKAFNIPSGGDYEGGYFDMLCVSSHENMKHYCSLIDHILDYRDAGIPLHSECLLKKHLYDQYINRIEYPVFLRGSQFNVKW
tara:strand:+ start:3725 stop:4351 length:627 start_codon:yes stop_codon:yes gene_type:complete